MLRIWESRKLKSHLFEEEDEEGEEKKGRRRRRRRRKTVVLAIKRRDIKKVERWLEETQSKVRGVYITSSRL